MACCLWRVDPTVYHHSIPIRGGHHLRIILTSDVPVMFSFKVKSRNGGHRKILISSASFKYLEGSFEPIPSGNGFWRRCAYEEENAEKVKGEEKENVQYLATKIVMNDGKVEWCDFAKNTVTKIF